MAIPNSYRSMARPFVFYCILLLAVPVTAQTLFTPRWNNLAGILLWKSARMRSNGA